MNYQSERACSSLVTELSKKQLEKESLTNSLMKQGTISELISLSFELRVRFKHYQQVFEASQHEFERDSRIFHANIERLNAMLVKG